MAGRNAPWILIFATLGATVMGGGASIGAVSKTYEWGMLMVVVSTGVFLQFIFSGLVVAPQFRRWKLYTVAGYFGRRFDEKTRTLALVLSLVFSLFIIAAQMAAFGSVLSTLFPDLADDQTMIMWSIVIGSLMVVIYSTAGGILAVIHTDIYQFVVLFVGFSITLFGIAPDLIAKWGQVKESVPPEFFSLEGGKGWLFMVTTFLAFLLGETFGPAYVTRFVIGKNIQHTRWGIAGVGIFLTFTFPIMIYFIALYARIEFPAIAAQQALPSVVQHLHNPVIAGLIIAALLSAVMSSADSALNSTTAIFTKDIFQHHLGWTDRGDGRQLKLARKLTVVLGLMSGAIAVLFPDIIGLLLFTYHIWAPGVIVPIVVGTLMREKSPQLSTQVFITMLVAVVSTLAYRLTDFRDTFDPAVFGVLVATATFGALRLGWRLAGKHAIDPPQIDRGLDIDGDSEA